jgi:hypothetical protein
MHGRAAPENADDTHPYKRLWPQSVHAVAHDVIPEQCLLNRVYCSRAVKTFLAAIVEKPQVGLLLAPPPTALQHPCKQILTHPHPQLFAYADEFQGLNVMYMPEHGQRNWHYDGSDFVVTLSLQKALGGGCFEFAPYIRGHDQPINKHQQCQGDIHTYTHTYMHAYTHTYIHTYITYIHTPFNVSLTYLLADNHVRVRPLFL